MGLNKSSRVENASKNAVSAFVCKIIVLFFTFVSRRIFIRYIGLEYLGINGLFANVLTLLSMADLGLGTALNVSLYRPIAQNDTKKITALLNYFRTIYTYIAIGVTVVGVGLVPFLKYLVNMESNIPNLYLFYFIFIIKNTVSYVFVYKSSLIRADQRTYIINRFEIIIFLIKTVLQIFIIIAFKSYLGYIVLDVLGIFVQNVLLSYKSDKDYPFITEQYELTANEKKYVFSDVSSVFIYKVAWCLLNGTDNILMSVICGTIYVGLYSNYYTITNSLDVFIGILFSSLTASVGNLIATSTEEKSYSTFKTMQMISFWICGIVVTVLLFIMQDFIQIWLGKKLLLDNLTVIAIVINVFFSNCMRPVWTYREGTGMYRQIRYIMLITAIVNLILSILLGKIMGLSGIIFATSISKFITYFWYEPNILFSQFFNVKPIHYYIQYVINVFIMLVSIGMCYYALYSFKQINIINLFFKIVICFSIVTCVYYLRYRKTEEFTILKSKIISIIRK